MFFPGAMSSPFSAALPWAMARPFMGRNRMPPSPLKSVAPPPVTKATASGVAAAAQQQQQEQAAPLPAPNPALTAKAAAVFGRISSAQTPGFASSAAAAGPFRPFTGLSPTALRGAWSALKQAAGRDSSLKRSFDTTRPIGGQTLFSKLAALGPLPPNLPAQPSPSIPDPSAAAANAAPQPMPADPSQMPPGDPSQAADPAQADPSQAAMPAILPVGHSAQQQADPAAAGVLQDLMTDLHEPESGGLKYDHIVSAADAVLKTAFKKRAWQRNEAARTSATGESTNLGYEHRSDDYHRGPDAWASAGQYLHHGNKLKTQPNPFAGRHQGIAKRAANWKPLLKYILGGAAGTGASAAENQWLFGDSVTPAMKKTNLVLGAMTGAAMTNPRLRGAAALGWPMKEVGILGGSAVQQLADSQKALANSQRSLSDTNLAAARTGLESAQANLKTQQLASQAVPQQTQALKDVAQAQQTNKYPELNTLLGKINHGLDVAKTYAPHAALGLGVGLPALWLIKKLLSRRRHIAARPKSPATRITLRQPGDYRIALDEPDQPGQANPNSGDARKAAAVDPDLQRKQWRRQLLMGLLGVSGGMGLSIAHRNGAFDPLYARVGSLFGKGAADLSSEAQRQGLWSGGRSIPQVGPSSQTLKPAQFTAQSLPQALGKAAASLAVRRLKRRGGISPELLAPYEEKLKAEEQAPKAAAIDLGVIIRRLRVKNRIRKGFDPAENPADRRKYEQV